LRTCAYPGCPATVDTLGGRGRPPKYCPEHRGKAASKRAVRLARLAGDACCADAKRVNPRARKCEQHKQWARFAYDSRKRRGTARDARNYADMLEAWGVDASERNFRIASNDTYLIESREDREQHKLADEFIAANDKTPYGGEKIPEVSR
jgi:hypothetical protein